MPAPAPEVGAIDAEAERLFVGHYLRTLNATEAYLAIRPNVQRNTAATQGYELKRRPRVAAAIEAELAATWKRLHMDADEALGRVSMDARSDIREAYDEDGHLLPVHLWPDSLVNSIEGLELRADGGLKIKFASKTAARRTILEIAKKVAGPNDIGALIEAVAARREQLAAQAAADGAR